MKKSVTIAATIFAAGLLFGCAEEPVEQEMITDETQETLESAPPEGTTAITPETGPDPVGDTAATDTTMTGDTAMTETGMED